jgi:hypothetical protein
MKLQLALFTGLAVVFLSFNNGSSATQGTPAMQKANELKPFRSLIRYAIVSNDVVNITGDRKDAQRSIVVLMDAKAFSEENLRSLFPLVSKRFPDPQRLIVHIFTSLEQVRTPEESETPGISEGPGDSSLDNYYRALFIREHDKELIRYSTELPVRGLRTVVLKGRDPQTRRP